SRRFSFDNVQSRRNTRTSEERLCQKREHRQTTLSLSFLPNGGVPTPLTTVWSRKQICGHYLRRPAGHHLPITNNRGVTSSPHGTTRSSPDSCSPVLSTSIKSGRKRPPFSP